MFILRLNRLRVFDNRTRKSFLGLFGEDAAHIKIASFVATDQALLPDLDRFVETSDEAERRTILAEAIDRTLSSRVFTSIPKVRDGHVLTFGDTGFAVHRSDDIPDQLDWMMLVIKSNQPTRNLGIALDELLAENSLPQFSANLLKVLGSAALSANPTFLAAAQIGRFIGETAGDILQRKNDELIGLYYLSLNAVEHYPHGERKVDHSPGVSGNISVDYSLFGVRMPVLPALPVLPLGAQTPPLIDRTLVIPTPPTSPLPPVEPPEVPVEVSAPPASIKQRVLRGKLVDEPIYSFAGDDAFFYVAEMSIDADGSPHAYHKDSDKGLDHLANAGRPGNWWALVTAKNGKPGTQKPEDPAPGFYISTTALTDPARAETDPRRYVDSETIPYFVLPGKHRTDAQLGDLGVIVNLKNRKSVGAIFADIGPTNHLGEASIAAAKALEIPESPRRGGASGDVFYLVFPQSGNGRPQTRAKIEKQAEKLFAAWGGMAAVERAINAPLTSVESALAPEIEIASRPLDRIVAEKAKLTMEQIADDRPLAREIQHLLGRQGFIDPPVDGAWGPISRCGYKAFCQVADLPSSNTLDKKHALALLKTDRDPLFPFVLTVDWIGRTIGYIIQSGFYLARAPGMLNIIYLEGVDPDGTVNDDAPNHFNDLRLVVEFEDGAQKLRGTWDATTEPGEYFTHHPLSPKGAARIALGQHRAWRVGTHHAGKPSAHEALVQNKPITVYRDLNQDFLRRGDSTETGNFGVNQHWGYDYPPDDIRSASAGCLVGRTKNGHREFIKLLKTDPRYQASASYTFYTTVLEGKTFLA